MKESDQIKMIFSGSMTFPARAKQSQTKRSSTLGLTCWLALASLAGSGAALANPVAKIPRVEASGGLVFQTQGGGTPNIVTGYLLAPLSQGAQGQVVFLDVAANMNLGGALNQVANVSAGASTRLGYRWLSADQGWMYGFNAGVDTRQAVNNYAFQAGVGAEALSRNLELRVNGYIPFANQSDLYQSGYTNAYLLNNQLILDGWNRYVVSLGGTNLEAGVPLARWNNNSFWLYASYYYLDGDYVNGSSGVRGRGELRIGNQLALGATISYDNIFATQATGYLRYGAKPLTGSARDAVDAAERNFLAMRGLPMQRETDLRMVSAQQNLPGSVATNPSNSGNAYVVRCTGTTTNTGTANVSCTNPSLDALLAAAGPGDVLLVGGGASSNLGGRTVRLAVGTGLTSSGSAPTLGTQFGLVNLNPVFGTAVGAQPSFSNGIISIGSNTTIAGFNFSNTSITNYSTSNVLIANNTFAGSYTDNPTALATAQAFGAINVSTNALPAIQLDGASNVTIANNSFIYPQVQAYQSQIGTVDGAPNGDYVCNQNNYKQVGGTQVVTNTGNSSGLCLSGNAIRMNNFSNTVISGNSIVGALDEALRLNNPSGTVQITNNFITGMRMGPDSNIGSAIILGMNRGSATVEISGNTITNNSPGVYPIVNGLVNGKTTVNPTSNGKNVIDPIELGLCRGKTSFPRMSDLYASPDFSGDCTAPTSLSLNVSNNVISLPSISAANPGIKQDGDGIDFNVGANGILRSVIANNQILSLGNPNNDIGDNGLTFDFRSNMQVVLDITNNYITNSGDSPIGFGVQNTSVNGQPGSLVVNLSGNTFSQSGQLIPACFSDTRNPCIALDVYRRAGIPQTTVNFFGTGTNELLNVKAKSFGTDQPDWVLPIVYSNNNLIVP